MLWLAQQENSEGSVWVKPDLRRLAAGVQQGLAVGVAGKMASIGRAVTMTSRSSLPMDRHCMSRFSTKGNWIEADSGERFSPASIASKSAAKPSTRTKRRSAGRHPFDSWFTRTIAKYCKPRPIPIFWGRWRLRRRPAKSLSHRRLARFLDQAQERHSAELEGQSRPLSRLAKHETRTVSTALAGRLRDRLSPNGAYGECGEWFDFEFLLPALKSVRSFLR